MPRILHSDQGQNFESTILKQILKAFGVFKSHTTAYHPQGDGMVECFTRSLLQLIRPYMEKEADWEQHLPLVLFAYRSAIDSLTGTSPFLLMLGRKPKVSDLDDGRAYDISSYQQQLQAKLAELQGFLETNLVEAAQTQNSHMTANQGLQNFTRETQFGFPFQQQES